MTKKWREIRKSLCVCMCVCQREGEELGEFKAKRKGKKREEVRAVKGRERGREPDKERRKKGEPVENQMTQHVCLASCFLVATVTPPRWTVETEPRRHFISFHPPTPHFFIFFPTNSQSFGLISSSDHLGPALAEPPGRWSVEPL